MAVFKWLSAISFTSLQAWSNALPATLTQPAIALLWNNGSITTPSGVPWLTLSGHATTASNNITIRPAPGESFADSGGALAFSTTSGVNFVAPATGIGNVNYFDVQDNNVVVQGLQFQDPNSASNCTIFQAVQTCTVQGCIFDGYGQTGGAAIVFPALSGASSSVFTFINNLVIDRAGGASTGNTFACNYNTIVANNTFLLLNASATQIGIDNKAAATGVSFKVINNVLIGYDAATVMLSTNSTITESFCLLSAASISNGNVTVGSGNVYSKTAAATFVNATTNFRLLASSSAINAGFTDTTDIPAAVDIFGVTRPQGASWDIGAAEFVFPISVATGGGQASGSAVPGTPALAIATGGGFASGIAVPVTNNVSIATGGGQASGLAISNANVSIATGGGRASGVAFEITGAVSAQITINPIGTETIGVPFSVSGTYTLTPTLQFADDANTTFTPIPLSGISAAGFASFNFIHPGVSTLGTHNLLVEDLVTTAETAQNYSVVSTPPPPPPTPPVVTEGFQVGPPTALQTIIPAYVYQQYADDDNIQAFFAAYNVIAQSYLDWFNAINLPVYTGPLIVGELLDWVGQGIYGIKRPTLAITQTLSTIGDFNTYDLNTLDFNGSGAVTTTSFFTVTDDIYKRILTWNLYKGDGKAFNTLWLKRRVARFLAGVNGTDYTGPADQISVAFAGSANINITITSGLIPLTTAAIFQAAVLNGALPLPFQYNFAVLINASVTVPLAPPPSGNPGLAFNLIGNSQYLPSFGF